MTTARPIVVVDDNPEIRTLLTRILAKHGFATASADGGPALRAILAEQPAALIVMDVMMPGEDGLTLCRWIHDVAPTPVILISARAGDRHRREALDAGAVEYVEKPFDPKRLVQRIRSILTDPATPGGQPGGQ